MLWRHRKPNHNRVDRRQLGGPLTMVGLMMATGLYFLLGRSPSQTSVQDSLIGARQEMTTSVFEEDCIAGVRARQEANLSKSLPGRSSSERSSAFKLGFEQGRPEACIEPE